MKKLFIVILPLLLSSCLGSSPCQVSVQHFGKYLIVKVKNTSKKTVKLAAQRGKISLAVKKKMGSWSYDLNNLTRNTGTVNLVPEEELVTRKFISKYDKKYKYKLELVCNGKKVETNEF